MFLGKELNELQNFVSVSNKSNNAVSTKNVGWHIDHTLKVIIKICEALQASNPEDYEWQFNPGRLFILSTGAIPRGRGESPKALVAKGPVLDSNLKRQLDAASVQIETLNNLHPKSFFTHQYFGKFDLNNTRKFLKIHTEHHLKIIRDIVKAN
ncbi:MAG: hypothetical protein AAF502_16625 [Bacteroidota bacterium]